MARALSVFAQSHPKTVTEVCTCTLTFIFNFKGIRWITHIFNQCVNQSMPNTDTGSFFLLLRLQQQNLKITSTEIQTMYYSYF